MPQSKQNKKQQPRRRVATRNRPRPQPNASRSIVRGLTGIANSFMPGAGMLVSGASKLLGFGAYSTADAENLMASRVPSMHDTLDRGIRVAHHEYLADLSSSTAYTSTKYIINPGISATFPWLSSVADAFQEYEINGLVFYFKSTSANALNSTNTALGQIMGAVQYNPYQADPTSKIQLLGLTGASDGKPSESNIYPVECKADMVLQRTKLIRTGGVSDDLGKYDHGNFYLAAFGSQASAVVGELHVVYDITLKKPKLGAAPTGGWYSKYYGTFCDPTHPFGSSPYSVSDNLGLTVSPTTLSIPPASLQQGLYYKVSVAWIFSAGSFTTPVGSITNGVLVNKFFNNTSNAFAAPNNGVTTIAATYTAIFQVTSTAAPVVFTLNTAGAFGTGTCSCDITLEEVL